MMRNYKYLLRPSKKQDQMLDFLLWQERIIYNAALEKRIRMYQETGKSLNYMSQWVFIRDLHRQHPDTFGLLNVNVSTDYSAAWTKPMQDFSGV